jgi:hypothetical protein
VKILELAVVDEFDELQGIVVPAFVLSAYDRQAAASNRRWAERVSPV